MSSTTESRKMRQRHSEASHKMSTRHHPYASESEKSEMEKLREENEAFRQRIQQLEEAELQSQERYQLVVDGYNGLLEEKEATDRENEELREQVRQLVEADVQGAEQYRQLAEVYNQLIGHYEELKGEIERLEAELEKSNEKFEGYSKEMEEKLEEAQESQIEAEEEVEQMKEQFKMRRENMAHNMEVLRQEKDKEIEQLKKDNNELHMKSYAFRGRQTKRRLFTQLDDALEFGDDEEKKTAQQKIKKMSGMLRNGEEIEELLDDEN